MSISQVYLDHQAATPLLPAAWEAMQPFFAEDFGNASSLHRRGLRARDALDVAREQMARFIHASSPEEIVFVADGTEAANLAIKGSAWAGQRRGDHLVVGAVEHPSVMGSVEFLEKHGFRCTKVGVDSEGRVDPEAVRAAITPATILIAVQLVNHDLGTIEPVREIAAIAAEEGITCYADAEAAAGWLSLDVQELGVDLLSLSPHRFHGPQGVGVLYRRPRCQLTSLVHGGTQEGGRRAGIENVPAIVGAGVAAEAAGRELTARSARVSRLQARLWSGLAERVPHLKLNGPPPGPGRVCNHLNVSVEFVEGEGLVLMLDTRGIAVTSGTSCISKALKLSPVLKAIGLPPSLGRGAVLLTLGKDNTEAEIDYVLETFPGIVSKLRGLSPMWDEFERGLIGSEIKPRRAGRSPGGRRAAG